MSWRTVIVANRAKIEFSMGFMIVRGEQTSKIFMDEISTVIVESTATALTAVWINECIKRKIKVIFCDETRNPSSELLPYYGSHDTSRKIRTQIRWEEALKNDIWGCIVKEKIRQQMLLLLELGKNSEADMLNGYISEVQYADASNREGHAAKVYFNALFGMDFTRHKEIYENLALNYGYSVLLSAFNREICACGYLTQLGIFHDNVFNQFNLGSDLMEPFRPLADRAVLQMAPMTAFGPEEKRRMIRLVTFPVLIGSKKTTVENAIGIYTRAFFEAMESEDIKKMKFYEYVPADRQ